MTHPTDPVAAMREACLALCEERAAVHAAEATKTVAGTVECIIALYRGCEALWFRNAIRALPLPGEAPDAAARTAPCIPAAPAHDETTLRRYLWLTHGHDGLYGDDGEMRCQRCPADYRRDPLPALAAKADEAKHAHGLAQLAKHAAAPANDAVRAALRLLAAPYGTKEWHEAGDALSRLAAPNGLKAAHAALDAHDAVREAYRRGYARGHRVASCGLEPGTQAAIDAAFAADRAAIEKGGGTC